MTIQLKTTSIYHRAGSRRGQSAVSDTVIALHCSGGNAKQWRALAQALKRDQKLITPEHYGTTAERTWCGSKRFTLADEAQQSLNIIDQCTDRIHLVGHSYGGSLALHIALARPDRVASVTLYEPCAFHLLPKLGAGAAKALSEIQTVSDAVHNLSYAGCYHAAMAGFVDYWNGAGAWDSMKPEQQDRIAAWAPNASLAFDALFFEKTNLSVYRKLNAPVHLLQGDQSPESVKVLCDALDVLLPEVTTDRLSGLGHMGPLTHADYVAGLISEHIESNTDNYARDDGTSNLHHVEIDCAA